MTSSELLNQITQEERNQFINKIFKILYQELNSIEKRIEELNQHKNNCEISEPNDYIKDDPIDYLSSQKGALRTKRKIGKQIKGLKVEKYHIITLINYWNKPI